MSDTPMTHIPEGLPALDERARFTAFLDEAAAHFESLPTNGEDRAHWANVTNAATCRKIAAYIAALPADKTDAVGVPVAEVYQNGTRLCWTKAGLRWDWPDGTKLYAAPPAPQPEPEPEPDIWQHRSRLKGKGVLWSSWRDGRIPKNWSSPQWEHEERGLYLLPPVAPQPEPAADATLADHERAVLLKAHDAERLSRRQAETETERQRSRAEAAEKALAEEREACARIAREAADNPLFDLTAHQAAQVGDFISAAILARGGQS
jgi:hypothetical protein